MEFKLDDAQQTPITLEAVVMALLSESIGLKFCSTDPSDANVKAIGFYLF